MKNVSASYLDKHTFLTTWKARFKSEILQLLRFLPYHMAEQRVGPAPGSPVPPLFPHPSSVQKGEGLAHMPWINPALISKTIHTPCNCHPSAPGLIVCTQVLSASGDKLKDEPHRSSEVGLGLFDRGF